MLKRTTLMLLTLLLILISLTALSAQDNSTAYEFIQTNEEPIQLQEIQTNDVLLEGSVGNFTELSNMISSSSSGDVVNLTKDYKYVSGDSVSSSGISISKKLTINGNGHIIDGSNSRSIFYVSASNVVLNNITFTNAYSSGIGGAIYASGSNFKLINSTINNTNSALGALYIGSSSSSVINSTFSNNQATGATAIYWYGSSGTLEGSTFINNLAKSDSAGAVFWQGSYGTIKNSTFINNTANKKNGGAVYWYGTRGKILDSNFYNNTAKSTLGGAIYWGGFYGELRGSKFINNTAENSHGGAVAMLGHSVHIYDSYFEANSANTRGGGLYYNAMSGTLDNLTFINNTAYMAGGAYLGYDYYENTDIDRSYASLTNSKFINNSAIYGGGAVDVISYFNLANNEFINNHANNYGGAVSIAYSSVYNSTFFNNSATFGGGVFSYNSNIVNSSFTANNATYGNAIYVVNTSNLDNNHISDEEDIYNKTAIPGGLVVGSHEIDHMLHTSDGYMGYCSELHNGKPYSGEYDHSMELLKNALNGQPVSEYLKILIYQYFDHMQDLKDHDFHEYVWAFTDRSYWNSTDPIVMEVIRLYDSGFRVPNINACKVLANGTLMYLNFSSLITPSSQQNLFLFKHEYGDVINETLTKEVLNKTAFVSDEIEYRIVVSNKGTSPIYDLWIEDKDYSSGLVYETWRPEIGNWTYNNQTGHWIVDVLEPAKSASVILTFRVMVNGTLYNNATSGVGNKNVTNSTNTTRVYNPNFTVEKIALNKTVQIGNQTIFEILLRNTGDIELTDVFIEEDSYDGLVYDSWVENSYWTHRIVNGKHRWYLNSHLAVDGFIGIRVIFNTTAYGNFTNVAVVGSNETENKTVNNTTKVLKPDFEVIKNVLTPYVQVGEQTIFEIVVRNTGEVDLDDIVVIEESYDGLIYNSTNTGDLWSHSVVNGKHTWKFNGILEPGEDEFFFVTFNTVRVGNFTNYVVATSNKTDNKTSNNTTSVNETVNETGNNSDFTVQKITVDKLVEVGQLVEFQILVKNTGNTVLHNVTIYESEYDGLTYWGYDDHFDFWTFNEEEMSWTLNSKFYPGEELGIHVYFNTTRIGNFTNCAVVSSNETDNKTANNTTKVVKPGISIEKIAINKTVIVGEQTIFEIVVHNVGEEVADDIVVSEIEYDGLVYDSFVDYTGLWSKNDDMSWRFNGQLGIGEYEGFFVVFNTTKRGNFTNIACVNGNDTDNDTVEVKDYNMSVSKITLNKLVSLGEQTSFDIVVVNTGDLDLNDVIVREESYDGLIYDSWKENDLWTYLYDDEIHFWKLNSVLVAGDSVTLTVIFNTTQRGNFTNIVVVESNDTDEKEANNTTEVVESDFEIEKVTLTPIVNLGNQAVFEIVVRNTGNTDLNGLFIEESSYDGLIYDSWEENDYWTHSIVNGKHRWSLNSVLLQETVIAVTLYFNTTQSGNFTNIVVAGSNQTDNKTSNNTTEVLRPDFEVVKNVLTPYVTVGNQTIFEIVVKNTGEVDLDDILVIEDNYDGLVYNSAITGDKWIHVLVGQKHAWMFNGTLKPDAEEFFFVIFDTYLVGEYTNTIIATSNKTDNKTAENTTVVNETVDDDEVYNFTVKKITLTPVVKVGDLVEFQILVKNTGESKINNLTIYESEYPGLVYYDFTDHFGFWQFNEKELSWTLNTIFYPGEELGIHIRFNTTHEGNFTNIVVVSFNETNKTSNDTVKVLKPEIEVEKIAVNKTVVVGDAVIFEIAVHNIGEVPASDVTVYESEFDGLIYSHYVDLTGLWTKNDDLSWTLTKQLNVGEYEGFFVIFNTTQRGNFTNYVVCDNKIANDTVEVLSKGLSVLKISLNESVVIGNNTEFEIIVTNTGDIDLDNVFVCESKYDSGLVYLSYESVDGIWKHSLNDEDKHVFTLTDTLKAGDSSSFRIIFKTTKVGNFTNTVEAGFGNTTVTNSTNITSVTNITVPDNNKTGPNNKSKPFNNSKDSINKTIIKTRIDERATGNPLLALLIALIFIPLRRFKN